MNVPPAARSHAGRVAVRARWVAVLAATLLVMVAPAPAHAHAGLIGSTPAEGSTLDRVPARVQLEFTERISEPAYLIVRGPGGGEVADGDVTVAGTTVSRLLAAGVGSGEYTMAYRVVSVDGHVVTGEIGFRLDVPEPSPDPSDDPSDDPSADPSGEPSPEPTADPSASSAGAVGTDVTEPASWWARHDQQVLVGGGALAVGAALAGFAMRRRRP